MWAICGVTGYQFSCSRRHAFQATFGTDSPHHGRREEAKPQKRARVPERLAQVKRRPGPLVRISLPQHERNQRQQHDDVSKVGGDGGAVEAPFEKVDEEPAKESKC
jgi:hypothetical protein